MDDPLYLDTARLGRMSPGARAAYQAFLALAGREGSSAYLREFLRHGLDACRSDLRLRHTPLSGWAGVGELKRRLRHLAPGPADLPVLLAGRTAQLMRLAARVLFHPCRHVLVTDLGWPAYHAVLDAEAARAGRRVTCLPIREDVLSGRLDEDAAVEMVADAYRRSACDGLFLTAVGHLGVRLPVARIASLLEATAEVRMTVVDGAQAFGHTDAGPGPEHYDLYLAGCHKWLGAYLPMGLGFLGRRRSRTRIETVLADMTARGDLDDPLLGFTGRVERGDWEAGGETVNLGPLLACSGALADLPHPATTLSDRTANTGPLASAAAAAGWRCHAPCPRLGTGIVLATCGRDSVRASPPDRVARHLRDGGVIATAYPGGTLRLSLPARPLADSDLTRLRAALATV